MIVSKLALKNWRNFRNIEVSFADRRIGHSIGKS